MYENDATGKDSARAAHAYLRVRAARDWVPASYRQDGSTTFNSIYNDDRITRPRAIVSRNILRTPLRNCIPTIVASSIGSIYGIASIANYVAQHGWH